MVTFLCDVALDFTCTQNRWQIGILYYFPRVCFELLYFYSSPNLLKLKFYKLFVHCNHGVYFPVTVFHNDQELKENVIKYTHVDFKISSNKYLFPLFFFFSPMIISPHTSRCAFSRGHPDRITALSQIPIFCMLSNHLQGEFRMPLLCT